MKFKFLTLFTISLVTATIVHAQKLPINIGVEAGVNLGNVNGLSLKGSTKAGYVIGAYADLNIAKKIAIEPAIIFNQTGGTTASSSLISGLETVKNFNLHYLSIPILVDYKIIPLIHVQLGPQFSTLLNSNESVVSSATKSFKSGDFSIIAGAEARVLKFRIGIQYVGGLTNVNKLSDKESWKANNARIYLKYNIF